MNYRIVCNTPVVDNDEIVYRDYVLFDYTMEGRELSKAVLTRSFNGNLQDGQLVFTIHPGHIAYNNIMLSLSTITVYDGDTEIFRGRPVSLQTSKTMLKTYTCEHMMKFMIDVPDVFSTADTDGNVNLATAIPAIINGYNSMVPDNRQILLSSNPITGKAKASKGSSVYSNLSTWLASAGYYAKIVKTTVNSNDVYTLSFDTDTGVIMDNPNDFRVVFRENILDYAETVNLDKLYTAVYPIGVDSGNEAAPAVLVDNTVTTTGQYAVNASKHLIYNEDVVPDYGMVILYTEIDLKGVADDDDVRKQAVYDGGVRALQNAARATESFTISAVDPRLVGMEGSVPIEGCYYLVKIPPFFGDEAVPQKLTQIVTDMTKPSGGSLTFGGSRNLLTDQSAAISTAASRAGGAASSAQKAANSAQKAANSDYITATATDGIWIYHKWASGLVECWGVSSVTVPANGWNGSGDIYYINGSEAFPSDLFVAAPELFVHPGNDNLGGNMFLYAAKYEPVTKTTAKYRLMRNANLSQPITIGVNLYAVGEWK